MLTFTKIQSNGNHFLVWDHRGLEDSDDALKGLAKVHCDVKKGIGADGLMLLDFSETRDFKMRLFNKNGSEAEMCGNGARCIARYAYDKRIVSNTMVFETLAGDVHASVMEDGVKIKMANVKGSDFGELGTIDVEGTRIMYKQVKVGVPHVLIDTTHMPMTSYDWMIKVGALLDKDAHRFPEGTNVNFVSYRHAQELEVTTYERGVDGLTDSCGTGSCASVLAFITDYGLVSPVKVINPGGVNLVYFQKEGQDYHLELEGKTHYCAKKIIIGGEDEDFY